MNKLINLNYMPHVNNNPIYGMMNKNCTPFLILFIFCVYNIKIINYING